MKTTYEEKNFSDRILASPRIGISKAQERLWRFVLTS
ncbi:MAG: DNA-3-methyladenine glycosylase [Chthoniobacterales bacterium]|nr:DNA-3-methyladenine glycosylase [Chthoniobacterales bacterium]